MANILNDPYVYQLYGQKGLSLQRTTSFLVPFENKIRNWEVIYCVLATDVRSTRKRIPPSGEIPSPNTQFYFSENDEETIEVPIGGGSFPFSGVWYNNRFAIGLKDEQPYYDVGDGNTTFIGMSNDPSVLSFNSVYKNATGNATIAFNLKDGTGLHFGFQNDSTHYFKDYTGVLEFEQQSIPVPTESFWTKWIMRFELKNTGTPLQSLSIGFQQKINESGVLTSRSILRSDVKNFVPDFQISGIAFDDDAPNAMYIRWPFTRTELKLHAFLIEKKQAS